MKRLLPLLVLVCLATATVYAETVDTTVCDVLANPSSFDGKIVRIKGTVIAGFDEFAIKDSSCGKPVNAIWLSYPEHTKGKAGPAAVIQLQLAKNSPGQAAAGSTTAVTLDKNKDFKQFDSLLSSQYKGGGCLGCIKHTVTATLTGRIDGVKETSIKKDTNGKFVAVEGFGNLNLYPARLVLQSVSDVSSKDIDYGKAPAVRDDSGPQKIDDPVAALRAAAGAFASGSPTAERLQAAANAFPKQGEHNGVTMDFAVGNEVKPEHEGKGNPESPDGLLINCTFDTDRLERDALSKAVTHVGSQIADLREDGQIDPGKSEMHAWEAVIFSVIAMRQKALTLPGGFVAWDASWKPDERNKMVNDALTGFITSWTPFAH